MMTDSHALIDAIAERIGESDQRRAEQFLDDLRQEGRLPGRRGRLAYRLRRARRTLRGWFGPVFEAVKILFTGRRPASYWVDLMDQLTADGWSEERAGQEVAWKMRREGTDQLLRWVLWLGVICIVLTIVMLVRVIMA